MLRILDNPLQDIPMAAVLTSCMGGFSDEELAKIRLMDRKIHLYDDMRRYMELGDETLLVQKIEQFMALYNRLRALKVHRSIEELIREIYQKTGYVYHMTALPGGEVRKANLERLLEYAKDFKRTSYRGLFHFIRYVDQLKEIDSLKIEGRMKTALYVATVARTYRKALDDYYESEEKYRANMEWYKSEIGKCTYRQFTTGFFFGKPTNETQIYDSNTYVNEYIYLGIAEEVREDGLVRIEQRNKFCVGDTIEIMKPSGDNVLVTVEGMYDADMNPVESCPHSKQLIYLKLSQTPDQYDLLRVHNVNA